MDRERGAHLLSQPDFSHAVRAHKYNFNVETRVVRIRGDDACEPPCRPRLHSHFLELRLDVVEALTERLPERIAARTPYVTLLPGHIQVSLADAERLLSQIREFLDYWRKPFIRTVRLDNILSYGPSGATLTLEPLNVLIGPNASGKSNLIVALSLLSAAPKDIQRPIREGGGVRDWLWKGAAEAVASAATVEVTVEPPYGRTPLRYRLSFTETGGRFELREEAVENEGRMKPDDELLQFHYLYREGRSTLNFGGETLSPRHLTSEEVKPDQSILSQRRDPDSYPDLTYLANWFESMRLYPEFPAGRHAPARLPQKTDLQQDRLLEDASNLGVVLSDLLNRPDVKHLLLDRLRRFYPAVENVLAAVSGGVVQIFFEERGLRQTVPATRLSDGSLRYLCLLAVLCHPDPPPVIGIEEPEMGLHPDVIPELADLLVKASLRSQIFVTTHSDILVDALTDTPESVIVCEKSEEGTQLRRLEAGALKSWLEEYRLGELWTQGEIGGNRW